MRRTARRLVPVLASLLLLPQMFGAPRAAAHPPDRPDVRQVRPLRTAMSAERVDRLHREAGASSGSVRRLTHSRLAATALDGFRGVHNKSPFASPSDSTGAAGPDFFVGAVNVHVQVFNRNGSHATKALREKTLFNNLPKGTDTDPKVVYDAYDHHFVFVYLLYNNAQGYIVVVTIPEATADQKSTWCHWVYPGDEIAGDGHQFADYPGLGFTGDRVTITTNNFQFSGPGYDYAQILSFKKSQLYDPSCHGTPVPRVIGGNRTDEPDGSKAFTLRPAETVGGTSPSNQYLASFDFNGTRTDDVIVWRLRFVRGKARLTKKAIPVGQVDFPPYGTQCNGTSSPDTKWDTGDTRLVNAFYDADTGLLYTAHAVAHQFGGAGTESAVRWYEVRITPHLSNASIPRKGFVGRDGYDAGWPSVATDANGVLFVNYNEASDAHDECVSALATTVEAGQVTDTGPTVLKAGQARYQFSAGVERWGDYTAMNRDPADPTGMTMAVFSSYAYDPTPPSSTTFLWDEWIGLISDT
jgi:hypothetical protein